MTTVSPQGQVGAGTVRRTVTAKEERDGRDYYRMKTATDGGRLPPQSYVKLMRLDA
jgi:hypothetical protein